MAATYIELMGVVDDITMRRRVMAACLILADKIRLEAVGTAKHAERLVWAKAVHVDSPTMSVKMIKVLVPANRALNSGDFATLTDAQIQAAVDGMVDIFL